MARLDDPEWLRERYHEDGMTLAEIGEEVGASDSTVRRRMDEHEIPRRESKPRPENLDVASREWLRHRYHGQGMSMREMAEEADVTVMTVLNWMNKHGVERRPPSAPSDERLADGEWLRERYVDDGASVPELADELGMTVSGVCYHLHKHGIETDSPTNQRYEELADPDWLREKYHGSGLTMESVAGLVGCSVGAVSNAMRRHGIEPRDDRGRPRSL